MIGSIDINNFRIFKDDNRQQIILGKYLTVIAGMNATGKSTILALLGNSCELKQKRTKGKKFRMEFSETLKGSKTYDPTMRLQSGPRCTVNFDDGDLRHFRVTWQDRKTRFRVIPYKIENGHRIDSKKEWPVIYLGLSRLFPIGESNIKKMGVLLLTNQEKIWFIDKYKEILFLNDDITSINSITISETSRKEGIGISTDKYDYLTNSAGQDNIGQILLSIIQFQRLKNKLNKDYSGGLLLIDEIDASLHPSAQNRLIEFLISEGSRGLGLQVVCTTHSLSLLKHIHIKTKHNNNENTGNNVELVYLTTANDALKLERNMDYRLIKSDLQMEIIDDFDIRVYTEDDEARWFLKKLIGGMRGINISIIDNAFGCHELIKLYKGDRQYFSGVIFVLDGDFKKKLDRTKKELFFRGSEAKNIICLPEEVRPEEVIYNWLIGLKSGHSYLESKSVKNHGLTKRIIIANGPKSDRFEGADRDKYKNWFKENKLKFESTDLYSFWLEDNKTKANEFIEEFKAIYDDLIFR